MKVEILRKVYEGKVGRIETFVGKKLRNGKTFVRKNFVTKNFRGEKLCIAEETFVRKKLGAESFHEGKLKCRGKFARKNSNAEKVENL